jgi:glucokinase
MLGTGDECGTADHPGQQDRLMAAATDRIVTVDVGGTHARFALAELTRGERPRLGPVFRVRTADHEGIASAWRAFAAEAGKPLPAAAAIGVAAPTGGDTLRFVNSRWIVETRTLARDLGVERLRLLNDFGAIAYAVGVLEESELEPITGPAGPLPEEGVISVVGPGTGLGVAMLLRRAGASHVIETEASHIGFAPLNDEEERLAAGFRELYGRASIERIVSGPGLEDIYRLIGGAPWEVGGVAGLWKAALEGSDPAAALALDLFVKCFGSAAGDFALAHGAAAVAIAGSLSNRMADKLKSPLFGGRFIAKGRYRQRMEGIRVRLVTHDEPGLLGGAAAFQRQFGP